MDPAYAAPQTSTKLTTAQEEAHGQKTVYGTSRDWGDIITEIRKTIHSLLRDEFEKKRVNETASGLSHLPMSLVESACADAHLPPVVWKPYVLRHVGLILRFDDDYVAEEERFDGIAYLALQEGMWEELEEEFVNEGSVKRMAVIA